LPLGNCRIRPFRTAHNFIEPSFFVVQRTIFKW
jgi:hypothetical protein